MSEIDLYKENAEPQSFLGALQSSVTNRLSRPYGENEPIVYEFTQDNALLHQYFRLREFMYRKSFKKENYNGGEDFHDKLSYILIARRGRLCLGGCRLTIREGDEAWPLPVEGAEFNLRDLFPELPLARVRHAEISRFAIMEDSGDKTILSGLCKVMYNKVTTSNIHYLFVRSPYHLARNWRLVANSFGVKTTRICNGIHPIDRILGPDITWYLTLSDLTSYCMDDSKNIHPLLENEALMSLNTH